MYYFQTEVGVLFDEFSKSLGFRSKYRSVARHRRIVVAASQHPLVEIPYISSLRDAVTR